MFTTSGAHFQVELFDKLTLVETHGHRTHSGEQWSVFPLFLCAVQLLRHL